MGKILNFVKTTRTFLNKEIRLFNASNTAPKAKLPFISNWMNFALLGMPRGVNIVELRQYAKSTWVQMVVSTITKQVMTTDYDVVVADDDDKKPERFDGDIQKTLTFLENPNRNGDRFWDIWGPYIKDVAEIDAGVVFKGRNVADKLVELFPSDGARFLVNIDEHGIIGGFHEETGEELPGYYQYSFRHPEAAPIPFMKNEVIYGKMNNNTELFPYGWSPLQSVVQEVELMIQSTRYNKEFFKNNATPDGIVSVNMDKTQMEQFKNAWETQVKGQPHKLIFHNSDSTFTPMSTSNKDMEWLEGQKWYFHLIFGAYGVSPQEAGFYENSNKSTGESQERITVKNAVKPYLDLIESAINRHIIPDLVGHDKIKFKFNPKDDAAEKVEHDQMMQELNASVLTINEVRVKKGLDPVDWGDQPMAISMMESKGDSEEEDPKKKDNPKDKKKPKDRDDKKEERESRKLYQRLFKRFMINGK